jgi:hypothetical protein
VDEVKREGEVGDELATGYKEENRYHAAEGHHTISCLFEDGEEGRKRKAYAVNEFSNQTSPSIHPTVVSPLKLRQLSTKSKLKCLPATSAVNNISAVAAMYHIICKRTICVRIFKGGSSVSAPGRGGRRLRGMVVAIMEMGR